MSESVTGFLAGLPRGLSDRREHVITCWIAALCNRDPMQRVKRGVLMCTWCMCVEKLG